MYGQLIALLGVLLWQLLGFIHPRASQIQWFAGRYPGSKIDPNVTVWHTTEGGNWPSYSNGATAPHFTIMANLKAKRLEIRQHFPTTMSARALRNLAGGVETNTLNALQVELIGTCSREHQRKYGFFYWPDAPEWVLRQLADFMVELHKAHPDFPLRDAAPRGWRSYPSSYANGAGQRMSFPEWRNAYGNVGHQHVPENVHGDPGNLDMKSIVAYAKAAVEPKKNPAPKPKPKPEPQPPTKVQRARALLRQAVKQAEERGNTKRAERLRADLDNAKVKR